VKQQVTSLRWITELARQVLDEILPIDPLAPVGCHHFLSPETGQHEITLFVSKTEVVGGADDGRLHNSRFCLDLNGIYQAFELVTDFRWQSSRVNHEDELGAHIAIEGIYRGYPVWLRILAEAPERYDHGRIINVHTAQMEDIWQDDLL
jgi:hypothetical protein